MRTDKEEICRRMDEIHTTAMGYGRISKNLGLCGADPVAHCKNIIMDSRCMIHRKGKNWYCEMGFPLGKAVLRFGSRSDRNTVPK